MINNDNINSDWESFLGGNDTSVESTGGDNLVETTTKTKTKQKNDKQQEQQKLLSSDQFMQFAELIAQTINITNKTNQDIQREERRQEQIARENAAKNRAGLATFEFKKAMEQEIKDDKYIPYHYAPVFAKRFGKTHEITINGYTLTFNEGEHTAIPLSLYQEVLNRFSGLMAKKVNGLNIFNFQFDKQVSSEDKEKLMGYFDDKLTQRR